MKVARKVISSLFVVRTLYLLFLLVGLQVNAMAPSQIQNRIETFRTILQRYETYIEQNKGLTPEAKRLKLSAQEIISQLRPYTTVTALEGRLRELNAKAQASYQKAATDAMDTVLSILGVVGGRQPFFQGTDYKAFEHSIYKNITDTLLKNIYTIMARLYPTNTEQGSKTRIVNNLLVLGAESQGREDVRELARLSAKNQGGALYWFNQHINRTFSLLNIFGDAASNQPYGTQQIPTTTQAYTAFLGDTNLFLKNIYPVGDRLMVRENGILQVSSKDSDSLYTIVQQTGKTVFGHLARDLNGYDKLIQFVTGYGIESEQYSPNSRQALEVAENIIKDFKPKDTVKETTLSNVISAAVAKGKQEAIQNWSQLGALASYFPNEDDSPAQNPDQLYANVKAAFEDVGVSMGKNFEDGLLNRAKTAQQSANNAWYDKVKEWQESLFDAGAPDMTKTTVDAYAQLLSQDADIRKAAAQAVYDILGLNVQIKGREGK